jgi:hypothetical protein
VSEVFSVTISDRLSDIDQVMQIVYDGFLESGYISPNPASRRMIPHYLTPGAAFILACVDGQPAGAIACIPDGPWGLPSDGVYPEQFAAIRQTGRVLEIGSLSVRKEFRSFRRNLVSLLMATSLRHLNETHPDGALAISVAPEQERFYGSIFSLVRHGDVVSHYGEPAVLLSVPTAVLIEGLAFGASYSRRAMGSLVLDPDPDWLTDLRNGVGTEHPEAVAT